ncbi:hypothetical protein BX070DRAFT_234753 [Coemansia spiralis]|nr:hypothetical protein BX070DRAFT_234753 [Coemansia spiralis]
MGIISAPPSSRIKQSISGHYGLGKQILPHVDELSTFVSLYPAKPDISTTIFMFRGDFSSPLYDLFTLQKRAIKFCDKDTSITGCDIKLPNNYKWGTLSSKLLDALDVMCRSPKKTDFYVKIDDDLVMSEFALEQMIRKMATTTCQLAGGIAVDYEFYWAEGQIYIFTRAVFDHVCSVLPHVTDVYPSEDITFGYLLNSTDRSKFCGAYSPTNHWHKEYNDNRVKIEYLNQHNE